MRNVIGGNIPPRETPIERFKFESFIYAAFMTRFQNVNVKGPLCTQCYLELPEPSTIPGKLDCPNCHKPYTFEKDKMTYRQEAHRFFDSLEVARMPFMPVDTTRLEEETSKFKIKAFFTSRSNKDIAIVYIFEKDANNGDKTQIFLDLDSEQVRYDPNDIPPGKILSKMTIEFKGSKQSIEYKENT